MSNQLFNIGMLLVLAGFVIIFVAAVILISAAAKGKAKIKGGGAVVIGPFPIVFGTDKESVRTLLLLSIVLTVLVLAVMVLYYYILK